MLFFLLALIYIWNSFSAEVLLENAEIALVGFHTLFNILGVILVLPFTRYFARLIEYLVPLESNYLYHLDAALPTKEPKLALIASQQALQKIFQASLEYIGSHLNGSSNRSVVLVKMEKSIDDVQEYIDEIVISESKEKEWEQLIALLHGVNHLERLAERCEGMEKHYQVLHHSEELTRIWRRYKEYHQELRELCQSNDFFKASKLSDKMMKMSIQELDQLRDEVILKIAKDEIDSYGGLEILNTIKWFKRILKHIKKFIFYYEKAFEENLIQNNKNI